VSPDGDERADHRDLPDDQDDVGTGSVAREVPRGDQGPVEGDLERVIAGQVRAYRAAAGVSVGEMAERVGISKAMLSKIENAQTSCSLTTLARLAGGLQVPVTALFRGVDAEREAVFVPAGHGAQIIRRGSHQGHLYELLGALRGPHKRMEAVLVTLTEASEVFPLFQHPGTELLFMLDGVMVYGHGEARYTMRPGDALQFDGEGAHGPEALLELPARFLSMTAYGDHG
jgi:transcriptional regulator with XRE-family HTH domain